MNISPKLSLTFLIIGSVALMAGTALIVWAMLKWKKTGSKGGGSTDELRAASWTSLRVDPTFATTDKSSQFSSWKNKLSALPANISFFPIHTLQPLTDLPANFYYKQCDLTPIQNQGSCNFCTLFATFGMLSSRLALISGEAPVPLSVQQAVDCSQFPCDQPQPLEKAFKFAESVGVVTAEAYPYEMKTGASCLTADTPAFSRRVFSSPSMAISPVTLFAVGDASHLATIRLAMTDIWSYGPICSIIEIYDDLLNKYRATAFDSTGKNYIGAVYAPTPGAVAQGYHCIQVIGWNKPNASNFNGAYWVVASSWGTNWPPSPYPGLNGCFFIQMGQNTCGIEGQMVSGHPVEVLLAT